MLLECRLCRSFESSLWRLQSKGHGVSLWRDNHDEANPRTTHLKKAKVLVMDLLNQGMTKPGSMLFHFPDDLVISKTQLQNLVQRCKKYCFIPVSPRVYLHHFGHERCVGDDVVINENPGDPAKLDMFSRWIIDNKSFLIKFDCSLVWDEQILCGKYESLISRWTEILELSGIIGQKKAIYYSKG